MIRWRIPKPAIVLALLLSTPMSIAQTVTPKIVTGSLLEEVFSWRTQRCDENYLPDSPARAFRRADGSVVLIAAHYSNGFLKGSSFDALKPDCTIRSHAHESELPEQFDTRYWIQALWPLPRKKVFAVVSHEYLGSRFRGRCEAPPERRVACWYSALAKAVASEVTLKFELLPLEQRLIAAPPLLFDTTAVARRGFFTTSNLVTDGQWLYLASWMEMPGGRSGNCLFRTPLNHPTGDWMALRGGKFSQRFPDPYRSPPDVIADADCDVIGKSILRGPLRSIVRLDSGLWLGTFQATSPQQGPAAQSGTFVTASRDLISWSNPQLVFAARQPWSQRDCDVFFEYPSLIDHSSTSPAFDRTGPELYLYLTRFNFQDCRKGLNRDLVRIKLKIQP